MRRKKRSAHSLRKFASRGGSTHCPLSAALEAHGRRQPFRCCCAVLSKMAATTAVTFTVHVSHTIGTGDVVCIIGSAPAVGSWAVGAAPPLALVSSGEGTTWKGTVHLPAGTAVAYKYIVRDAAGALVHYEDFAQNRIVVPNGDACETDDGVFGASPGTSSSSRLRLGNRRYITVGVNKHVEVNLKFGLLCEEMTAVLRGRIQDAGHCVVVHDASGCSHTLQLPLAKLRVVSFSFPSSQEALIFVTAYASQQPDPAHLVARGVLTASQLVNSSGIARVQLLDNSLLPVAQISVGYLVCKPFLHPAINLSKLGAVVDLKARDVPVEVGHRGSGSNKRGSRIDENTILSFVAAARNGVSLVEFDVMLSKDGIPVIHHDHVIAVGSAGVKVPVHTLTLAQLREVKDGPRAAPKNERPGVLKRTRSWDRLIDEPQRGTYAIADHFPTLVEAFTEVPVSLGFDIEIKSMTDIGMEQYNTTPPDKNALVDNVLRIVFDHVGDRLVMFSSFDPDVCTLLMAKQPRFPVFLITWWAGPDEDVSGSDTRCHGLDGALDAAVEAELRGLVCEARFMLENPGSIRRIKAQGLMLLTYGNENEVPEAIFAQKENGVDGVISDNIARTFKRTTHFSLSRSLTSSDLPLAG